MGQLITRVAMDEWLRQEVLSGGIASCVKGVLPKSFNRPYGTLHRFQP